MIPRSASHLEALTRLNELNQPAVSVTLVESSYSTPQRIGAKMLVSLSGEVLWGTIGGGAVEKIACERCITIGQTLQGELVKYDLNRGTDELAEKTDMICGGEMTLFFEPINIQPTVYVFGAGHIARELVPLSIRQGFNAVVVDDRINYASEELFPEATEVICGDWKEEIEKLIFSNSTYIVIITYSHDADEIVLKSVIQKEWFYLGMIASKRKAKEIKDRLLSEGFSEEKLEKIHSPIGIPISSQTPFEVSISIIAEIIKEQRKVLKKANI
ncbi:MAG: XdhC family protein [Candidatus Kariarchaeaceae archaeon]